MSTAPVFSEIQKINPSAIIELFVLQLVTSLHGTSSGLPSSNNENNIYRFHAGSNLNANGEIVWAGNSYLRFPIQASGFAFQRGQLPRPKIIISNATGLISSILLTVNETTTGNDETSAATSKEIENTNNPEINIIKNNMKLYSINILGSLR